MIEIVRTFSCKHRVLSVSDLYNAGEIRFVSSQYDVYRNNTDLTHHLPEDSIKPSLQFSLSDLTFEGPFISRLILLNGESTTKPSLGQGYIDVTFFHKYMYIVKIALHKLIPITQKYHSYFILINKHSIPTLYYVF